MARIPFQNELTENLRNQRLPSITNTATVENLAAEENQLAKIAGVGAEVMQKFAIKKQNEEDVKDTQYTFAAWKEHEFKYESDMLRAKGAMAKDSAKRTQNWWQTKGETLGALAEDVPDDILTTVGNDTGEDRMTHYEAEKPIQTAEYLKFKQRYDALPQRLKNALDLLIEKRRPDMLKKAMAHESKERALGVVRASDRTIKQSKIQIVHNYNNPKRRNEEMGDISNAIKAVAKLEGWGKPETDAVILGHVSEAHQTVITQYLAENTDQGLSDAENYRKNHPGEMTLNANKAMITAIRDKEVFLKSDKLSDVIIAGSKDWTVELAKEPDRIIRAETLSMLYTKSRIENYGKVERVRQQENAMHEMVVQAGRAALDFNNLGPELQPIWDALPFRTKRILKKMHEDQIVEAKPVNELGHAAAFGNVMEEMWANPKDFLATNFAIKYYGMLKPEAIQYFQGVQAKMRKEDRSGAGSKDYMAMWFEKAGWTGEDNAPRRGQAQIDLVSAINDFKVNNNERDPDDLEIQNMIKEKMGTASYRKDIEKTYRIAPATPPKPAAGVALGTRGATALNIAGYYKGATTFAGWFNSEENRRAFALATQRMDFDVEKYKAAHEGKISDRREQAIVNRIANDLVYVDGLHEETPVLRATLDPGIAGNKIYVLIGPKGTDKVYYHQLLGASKVDKKAMAVEIANRGIPESVVNLAKIWMARNVGAVKLSSIEIQNPSGGRNVTGRELTATAKGVSVDEMETMTPSIFEDYGPLAESAWEMLIEGKRRNAQHTEDMNRLDDLRKGLKTGPMQELR